MEANGFSRQFVYKKEQSEQNKQRLEEEIVSKVLKAREKHRTMGARMLYHYLNVTSIGINKFEQIVSRNGLSVAIKKKRIITTDGFYEEWDKNLINGLVLDDINQVIAGDITYFILKEETYYIFTLKDMYSKRIVGLYGSDTILSLNAIKTLGQVVKLRGSNINECIHHSDAGSQYKSTAYKNKLRKHQLVMSIADNCLQNGMAEQLNGVLKNSYLFKDIKNVNHLNKKLKEVKRLLNYERPIEALGYRTPVEFEKWIENIASKPKVKLYDFTKQETPCMGDFKKA